MKTRLLHLLEIAKTAFWVVPAMCLLAALGLALTTVLLDSRLFHQSPGVLPFLLYFGDRQSVQALLSTTAASVLGVAGVSFSITIASLTLASQQYGPRLLRTFMQDRFNQAVIGLFSGTFLFCMLVMQFTNNMDTLAFTPVISMFTVLTLIVVDLLLLVFFIHHVALSIQADTIISEVQQELCARLLSLYPERLDEHQERGLEVDADEPECADFEASGKPLHAEASGYLQAIDTAGIRNLASEHGLIVKLHCRAGDFVTRGSRVGLYLGDCDDPETLEQQLKGHLLVGTRRTPEQDPEFAVRQLEEIAIRALSPGVNDPHTAITVIHWLGAAMVLLLSRRFPPERYRDDQGRLQLISRGFDFPGILDSAFDQIRQNLSNQVGVIIAMLEMLRELALQAQVDDQRDAIRVQADSVYRVCQEMVPAAVDLADIERRYRAVAQAMER